MVHCGDGKETTVASPVVTRDALLLLLAAMMARTGVLANIGREAWWEVWRDVRRYFVVYSSNFRNKVRKRLREVMRWGHGMPHGMGDRGLYR
jgi:hypothetical protein